jgi:hypothetical protein
MASVDPKIVLDGDRVVHSGSVIITKNSVVEITPLPDHPTPLTFKLQFLEEEKGKASVEVLDGSPDDLVEVLCRGWFKPTGTSFNEQWGVALIGEKKRRPLSMQLSLVSLGTGLNGVLSYTFVAKGPDDV